MDVFAFYFPQFYEIDENNAWWGEGFTDWQLIKPAKCYSEDQYQPRVPLNNNYYDQSERSTIEAQIALAEQYGLAGFNFYHYWFDGKLMLEKPIEHFKNSTGHNLKYCITWANESWTRQWIGSPDVLVAQSSSTDREIWRQHYLYLREHFQQENYLKIDGKPVLCIYRPEILTQYQEYMAYFDELAQADGIEGIHWLAMKSYDFATQNSVFANFKGTINFQPRDYFNKSANRSGLMSRIEALLRSMPEFIQRPVSRAKYKLQKQYAYDYQDFCEWLLKSASMAGKSEYQSIIADWDNTARYGVKSKYFKNTSVDLFEKTLRELIRVERENNKELLFINAWNEWSEGAYLEPDEKNAFAYLQALSKAVK
ncbi:MAG: glycoside hydrolase family 99-like domain-containing protein [Cellvibrionaceae bacterium]|nr:glycoside hydrolase family 99-like domain-containing protein [Cellvibrionaceae bacterium]